MRYKVIQGTWHDFVYFSIRISINLFLLFIHVYYLFISQESQAIMDNLNSADRKYENERSRQSDMIEKRRLAQAEKKKKTTEEKALELLEAALMMDKQ